MASLILRLIQFQVVEASGEMERSASMRAIRSKRMLPELCVRRLASEAQKKLIFQCFRALCGGMQCLLTPHGSILGPLAPQDFGRALEKRRKSIFSGLLTDWAIGSVCIGKSFPARQI